MSFISATAIALLSSGLLWSCFAPLSLHWLGWVALVPLFVTLLSPQTRLKPLVLWISGVLFFFGLFSWIFSVPNYTFFHHVMLGLYMGFYFALFGGLVVFIAHRVGCVPALFSAPFAWVILEYARSNLGFLALPWGLLGHSQYEVSHIIQSASLAGTYFVSFLVVLVNSAVTAGLCLAIQKSGRNFTRLLPILPLSRAVAIISFALIMVTGTLLFGSRAINREVSGKPVGIGVVQPSIAQSRKWDPDREKAIMNTLATLTKEVSDQHPDLIVWPETATPRSITTDLYISSQVKAIAQRAGVPLLVGSSQRQKDSVQSEKKQMAKNSAFLVYPERGRKPVQRYDKIRLFPFGEYLPMKGLIPWGHLRVPDVKGFEPGNKYTVFDLRGVRFGVTICWENIFPQMVRQFVENGAQFIVNITNEAWFDDTIAPAQFLTMNVFRAVENRVFVVRCANTGISCVIDPCGRVIDRVMKEDGRDTFVSGTLIGEITSTTTTSFYTRYGDWFVGLSAIVLGIVLVIAVFRGRK